MKITISHYEGQAEFSAFSAEMSDDTTLSDFSEHLEMLVQCIYGKQVELEVMNGCEKIKD